MAEPPFRTSEGAGTGAEPQRLEADPEDRRRQDRRGQDVGPQSHGDREINPVKVNLALFDGSKKVSDLKPVTLARGRWSACTSPAAAATRAGLDQRPVKAD